ncbi:MAG: UDP-4-amino-4,6-dideoxy-N-acetyl-beta-L-altrosamine transaminase [Alphaproteobacteria bacterium]|jgi:UDP-4-amino-4,6-dideoxy-N-acetyl-beta-L-altrosamine transaminase|nr:UDP-4-amino-4,6-dideoxy-N-acetyl-beta-L-altrosamine transaminase [Alphaproteobacteria bacterium]MCS5597593.1 UDP-4-amino-4,6-dideoxy-N-acetyl-beta-L-altrosamine transaminase [Alphaproteobacteria bacterium]|tara:strand:+ start:273 stop:1409 length:1137 start_codon:yes stop_codon:yes gene_type:complete
MFIPYGKQEIDHDDINAVVRALKSDYLTSGPTVGEFEKALADITKASEAVVCSNGTTALHLALLALGVGPGDAVIVPTVTFLATANSVRYTGADVVFADVDPETGLMTPEHFQGAINRCGGRKLKVVMPVHLGGHICDLKAISKLAKENDCFVVADSCHALGGIYSDEPVGAGVYEDMSVFSFHPVKTVAMGEGGAITTRHKDLANTMRKLRSHGMEKSDTNEPWAYDMRDLGYNYRVTDIQCALGLSQLSKLNQFIRRRADLAERYNTRFKENKYIRLPQVSVNSQSGWHLYSIGIDFDLLGKTRSDVMAELKSKSIGTQVHYIPVHTQPYYQKQYGDIVLPGAHKYYNQTLSIPLYPSLSDESFGIVVNAVNEVMS